MTQCKLTGVPEECWIEPIDSTGGQLIHFQADHFSDCRCAGLQIDGADRKMTLQRYDPFWIKPMFGTQHDHANTEILYYLCRSESGEYGLLLPLCTDGVRSWLQHDPESDGLILKLTHDLLTDEKLPLLYWQTGMNPYELTEEAMRVLSGRMKTFRIRTEKQDPEFADLFGWCTWDAYYKEVCAEKVKAGLEAFKEVGFIPPFLILDDGWQEIKDQMLWEFSPNEKFPDGLGALVRLAKEHYGVQRFGVWHTMQGYWSGVHFSGPLAQRYGVKEVHQARYYQIPGKEDDYEIQTRGLIDKEDVGQFYTNYYRYLKQQGVDTVKVDNQGGLEDFVPDREEALDYANAYQQAVQSAVDREFGGNSIHCMSQSSDIFYALKSAQVVRNSQDYFPAKDESHGHHIHANGMNNIWTSTFCLPDWDMFHSNHFTAEFHAAARAISGGPIYISDVPESVNFELVKKLCTSTGKNLRCDQPALPAEECLFVDCVEEDYLFKVTNRHRGVGLLGLFNCQSPDGGRAIRGYASVTDIPDFSMDGRCVAFSYRNKELRVVEANERMEVTLEPLCYELMSFSPMINGIAPIGLIEKFNSSWVFDSFAPIDSGAAFRLRTGGTILLYTENYPKQVTLEDRDVAFSCAGHHLQIVLPEDTTGLLNIYLG